RGRRRHGGRRRLGRRGRGAGRGRRRLGRRRRAAGRRRRRLGRRRRGAGRGRRRFGRRRRAAGRGRRRLGRRRRAAGRGRRRRAGGGRGDATDAVVEIIPRQKAAVDVREGSEQLTRGDGRGQPGDRVVADTDDLVEGHPGEGTGADVRNA